jgi:hypothetical protein
MFANFELSRGGLVAADVKPKRTRTDLGCLPCMYSPPSHITQSDGLVRTSSLYCGALYSDDTSLQLTLLSSGRRKKKKCDLAKPDCVRCRKSTGSVVCEWPPHTSSQASEHGGKYQPRIEFDSRRDPVQMSKGFGSSTQTTMVLRDTGRNSDRDNLPSDSRGWWETPSPQNSIENCITISLPTGINKANP